MQKVTNEFRCYHYQYAATRLSIAYIFNPLYSDGFFHSDEHNKDGIVHYMF